MGNNLRWKALWYVDWISVNGETDGDAEGSGDKSVSVGITHGQGTRETSSTTITFIYYDDDTGEEVGRRDVKVCRCICGCPQLDFWPDDCNCDMLDFWPDPCNCDNFEIVDVQMLCDCDNFEIDQTPLSWDWNKKTQIEIPFTKNCIESEITTSVTDNHFGVQLTSSSIIIEPNDINTNLTPVTETLTISYSTPQEPNCSKQIELTHKKMVCNCGNFEVTNVINPFNNNQTE